MQRILLPLALVILGACTTTTTPAAAPETTPPPQTETMTPTETAPPPATEAGPTAEEATKFVAEAETQLEKLNVDQQRAAWVQSTFITYDTQIIAARENERLINAGVDLAKKAARYDKLELPYDIRRKLDLI